MPSLPIELIDYTFDFLPALYGVFEIDTEFFDDRRMNRSFWSTLDKKRASLHRLSVNLKACSLVCKTLVHISRKLLFQTLVIDGVAGRNLGALIDKINNLPCIAPLIRDLTITITEDDYYYSSPEEVGTSFRKLSQLRSVTFNRCNYQAPSFSVDWEDKEFQDRFLPILSLPSVTSICLVSILNINLADFAATSSLRTLLIFSTCTFDSTSYHVKGIKHLPPSFTPITLKRVYLRRPCPDPSQNRWEANGVQADIPILDFSTVEQLFVTVHEPVCEGLSATNCTSSILDHCRGLVELSLKVQDSQDFRGLASLLTSSFSSLRHINLEGEIEDNHLTPTVDPLLNLIAEFDQMSGKTTIQTIAIRISIGLDSAHKKNGWNLNFDSVFSGPRSWISLRRLSLEITKVVIDYPWEIELMDYLRKLTFPTLQRGGGIEFIYNVVEDRLFD